MSYVRFEFDSILDVAIGAPYGGPGGRGSIYIYHGSVNGLETQAVQVC